MEAQLVEQIPVGPDWQYEPKWDGFRCLAFRRGQTIYLQSKAGQPLARYFPELVADLLKTQAKQFVLDGELVIARGDQLSFDDLLMRIHPAESRIRKLSHEAPALYIIFDLLEDERGQPLIDLPLTERRKRLKSVFGKGLLGTSRCMLSPATRDVKTARKWFSSKGTTVLFD
jgi:ATP-dependent DNA ligase